MRKIIVTLGLLSVSVFANEHAVAVSDTDFIPRLVNFLIFAGILWYLLADKIKDFFSGRSQEIANSFAEIEAKLRASDKLKQDMKLQVQEANKKAEEIVNGAKKEVELIKNKILDNAKSEIEMLNKQFEEQKKYEESKMKKEVVESYLNNLMRDIHLSSEEVADIVTKKVG